MKDEEIQLLKNRSFHLDCPSIQLTSGDAAKQYAGPGCIRQHPQRDFRVTLFVRGRVELSEVFEGFNATRGRAGKLIPREEHWSLTAVDTKGRTWTATDILSPDKDGCVARDDGCAVRADCSALLRRDGQRRTDEAGARVGIELRSFSKLPFPRTHGSTTAYSVRGESRAETRRLNVAVFTSCGFEFELVEKDDAIVLQASSTTSPLPAGFESRISEALLLVLGTLPPWSITYRYDGGLTTTKIVAANEEDARVHRPVPIRFHLVDETNQTWRLFDLFLKRILDGDSERFHPLSTQVWAVSKTNAASVEARALTLAVAVETLLGNYFEDVAKPCTEHVALVDDLIKHVRTWSGDAVVRERALGAIGSIKGTRPGDKLRELEGKGLITGQDRQAWSELRNAATHGDWSAVREDLQAFLDRIEQVRVLFYRLIFAIIGYEGKHTDWATYGWPLIQFPPGSECPSTIPPGVGPGVGSTLDS